MEQNILQLFNQHPQLALLISIAVSVVVAILGVVPSVFITAANILFFGFWNGTLVSFSGEAIGAGVAFWLYRAGFKKPTEKGMQRYPKVRRLLEAEGKDAFVLIFSLRLIPFIPSGLITFAAAIGKVALPVFLLGSSLGKIPSLLMEAWSVQKITEFGWEGKLILAMIAVGLLYYVLKPKR